MSHRKHFARNRKNFGDEGNSPRTANKGNKMSHPYYHSKSSAKRFGGVPEDYIHIHEWMDSSKAHMPDARHRAILHTSFGIYLAQQVFGETITRASDGKKIPTRLIAELHVLEDTGFIPTVQDYLKEMPIRSWMTKGTKALSRDKELDTVQEVSEKL